MKRNAAHVMKSLSDSGKSVVRFEVQKVVKGGFKARLLILNVDIRVLIQVAAAAAAFFVASRHVFEL